MRLTAGYLTGQAVQAAGKLHGCIFAPRGLPGTSRRNIFTAPFAPMPLTRDKWIKFVVAIALGNALYFALSPHLPPAAQHRAWTVDLGTVVDFWLCLLVYGLLELGAFFRREDAGRRGPKK
ncbi:MAG: hypothetical protein ABSF45_19510 [Terriglobia bacterium]